MLIDKINGAYPLTAENVPALYAEYLALPESEKALIGSDEAIIDLLNKYAELGGGEPTTQPPATAPPVTEPPTTQLPTTQPPTTQPPTTQPPTTQPPTTEPTTGPPTTEPDDDDDFFYIGEKVFITQRGETLYTLVFDSIVFTSERNPYSDINPTSVVIVTYTYENIAEPDVVYIDWTNFADLDNTFDGGFNKFAGYPLVIPNSSQPRRINVGEKHTAKQALYLISDRYSSIIVVDFRDSFLDTFSLGAFILVANESSEPPTTQPPTTQPPATQPTTQPTTQPSTTPPEAVGKFVIFWGNTGDKLHIDPTCRTIKNGVLSGSYEQAIAAGHTEGWCKICSDGWTDARFWREGNPYAK
jgi:hypothetical protein